MGLSLSLIYLLTSTRTPTRSQNKHQRKRLFYKSKHLLQLYDIWLLLGKYYFHVQTEEGLFLPYSQTRLNYSAKWVGAFSNYVFISLKRRGEGISSPSDQGNKRFNLPVPSAADKKFFIIWVTFLEHINRNQFIWSFVHAKYSQSYCKGIKVGSHVTRILKNFYFHFLIATSVVVSKGTDVPASLLFLDSFWDMHELRVR